MEIKLCTFFNYRSPKISQKLLYRSSSELNTSSAHVPPKYAILQFFKDEGRSRAYFQTVSSISNSFLSQSHSC
ncbi:hypothetical protein WN51_04612 [Melipona quadrifasciata]|uniref:Uncharacterized protein n=1 Tax=Melipona quadrifasciata TaxID=166423 RepID=A0A0M8ZS96_9HYME|nr:hypothetical protein WN51_04612 [Melipona quadrifasciata]